MEVHPLPGHHGEERWGKVSGRRTWREHMHESRSTLRICVESHSKAKTVTKRTSHKSESQARNLLKEYKCPGEFAGGFILALYPHKE